MFRKNLKLKVGLGCVSLLGIVQAAPVNMTSVQTISQGNLNWQDINGASYTWVDNNSNNMVDVGEKVTFTIDMHKKYYGTHNFDALKVWIDETPVNPPASTLFSQNFVWDYNAGNPNYANSSYSYKPWDGGDKFFSFDYTFTQVGSYALTASVMCSRDLSGLTYYPGATGSARWNDNPSTNDWNAWTQTTHATAKGAYGSALQGETERFQLCVVDTPVPEPNTLSLLFLGAFSLGGGVLFRKKH